MEIGSATIYFYPANPTSGCFEAYYDLESMLYGAYKKMTSSKTARTVDNFFKQIRFWPNLDFDNRCGDIYEIKPNRYYPMRMDTPCYYHIGCTIEATRIDFQFIEWLQLLLKEKYEDTPDIPKIKMSYLLADDYTKTFIAENQEGFRTSQMYRVFEPMGYTSNMTEEDLYDELAPLIYNVMELPKPYSIQTAIFLVESYQKLIFAEEDEDERYLCFPYKEQTLY